MLELQPEANRFSSRNARKDFVFIKHSIVLNIEFVPIIYNLSYFRRVGSEFLNVRKERKFIYLSTRSREFDQRTLYTWIHLSIMLVFFSVCLITMFRLLQPICKFSFKFIYTHIHTYIYIYIYIYI